MLLDHGVPMRRIRRTVGTCASASPSSISRSRSCASGSTARTASWCATATRSTSRTGQMVIDFALSPPRPDDVRRAATAGVAAPEPEPGDGARVVRARLSPRRRAETLRRGERGLPARPRGRSRLRRRALQPRRDPPPRERDAARAATSARSPRPAARRGEPESRRDPRGGEALRGGALPLQARRCAPTRCAPTRTSRRRCSTRSSACGAARASTGAATSSSRRRELGRDRARRLDE